MTEKLREILAEVYHRNLRVVSSICHGELKGADVELAVSPFVVFRVIHFDAAELI